jgi:transposase InsO family protein
MGRWCRLCPFVHTFKRDHVNVHGLRDADSVLAQLAAWTDDYNRLAPHSALGMRSPADYWAVTSANRELPPLSSKLGRRSLPGRIETAEQNGDL